MGRRAASSWACPRWTGADALENTTRNIASTLRVEIALHTALDEPLRAYELPHLHGQGSFPWESGHGREERVGIHARPQRALGEVCPGPWGTWVIPQLGVTRLPQ
jgi:hypothetical protein